jgi:hypothetical protein
MLTGFFRLRQQLLAPKIKSLASQTAYKAEDLLKELAQGTGKQ